MLLHSEISCTARTRAREKSSVKNPLLRGTLAPRASIQPPRARPAMRSGFLNMASTTASASTAKAATEAVRPASTRRWEVDNPRDMQKLADALRPHALTDPTEAGLLRAVLDRIPPSTRIVLIGEASHGTEDFYRQRAELTKLLITERGFGAVLCEADFPDMFEVNRYVRGMPGAAPTAVDALAHFSRFPRWMWRNTCFSSFVDWLRQHNMRAASSEAGGGPAAGTPAGAGAAAAAAASGPGGSSSGARARPHGAPGTHGGQEFAPAGPKGDQWVGEQLEMQQQQEAAGLGSGQGAGSASSSGSSGGQARMVGLYGLDLYSMHSSAAAVVDYLSAHDPEAAAQARARYRCLDKYGSDAQSYGMAVGAMRKPGCEQAALAALRTAWAAAEAIRGHDGVQADEEALQVEANAMVVAGAEEYYRAMFSPSFGRDATWNLRDSHFLATAKLVDSHLAHRAPPGSPPPRIVMWAHNSHLGDARATDMSWRRHEHNLGQLAREAWGREACYTVGFSTFTGTVAAADEWGEDVRIKRVRPGMHGSIENIAHRVSVGHEGHEGHGRAHGHARGHGQAGGSGGVGPLFALHVGQPGVKELLKGPLLERAIGVIYRPDTERWSHYFDAWLPGQFDCLIHVDETRAVTPLDLPPGHPGTEPEETLGDLPETYPEGV